MSDDRTFIHAFETCTLSADLFDHQAHVRLAWLFLREAPVLEALERFSRGLRRFAASVGMPDRYHQTVTWAYIFLIHERMERTGRDASFATFASQNPDLLERSGPYGVLGAYYREETLRSELARRVYVLPDRWYTGP